jgi:hypothetical protein
MFSFVLSLSFSLSSTPRKVRSRTDGLNIERDSALVRTSVILFMVVTAALLVGAFVKDYVHIGGSIGQGGLRVRFFFSPVYRALNKIADSCLLFLLRRAGLVFQSPVTNKLRSYAKIVLVLSVPIINDVYRRLYYYRRFNQPGSWLCNEGQQNGVYPACSFARRNIHK